MTREMVLVYLVLLATLVLFVCEAMAVEVVALLALAALVVLGVLNPAEALQGFANPAVITVGAMFILSEGLARTGTIAWITRLLTRGRGADGHGRTALALGIVLVTSAFVNNTAVVVLFVPVMLHVARRNRLAPSKLLLPVSYASILGGTCTLIGTSTNILVSEMAQELGEPAFHFFEFTPVGALVAALGMAYVLFVLPRLLPERATFLGPGDEGVRQYVTEVQVRAGSSWVGRPLGETPLRRTQGLHLLEVIRGETILPPAPDLPLAVGDLLLLQGDANALYQVDRTGQVEVLPGLAGEEVRPGRAIEISLAEIVITPNSRLIGQTIREVGFRRRWGVTVFALQRGGRHLRRSLGDVALRVGDVLLVQGPIKALENLQYAESFLLVKGAQELLTRPGRAPLAGAILGGVVAAATAGIPVEAAAFVGAVAMIAARCLRPAEAYAAVDARVLLLVVGTLGLGHALHKTGGAHYLVAQLTHPAAALGPHGLLLLLFGVTAFLTSLVSNNATAVLLTPIALELAASQGLQPRPFLMGVVFGASAAYATPIGYQTNVLVFGPGGYFFRDFVKAGLPLVLLVGAATTVAVPWFFPF